MQKVVTPYFFGCTLGEIWRKGKKDEPILDGDTMYFEIDCGFNLATTQPVRLLGLNAYETKGEEKPRGELAELFVKEWFAKNFLTDRKYPFFLQTQKASIENDEKREKYGRYLGVVYNFDKTRCLNEALLCAGFAKPYTI